MTSPASDRVFAGSIPELYENYSVPLILSPTPLISHLVWCSADRHAFWRSLQAQEW